MYRPNRTGERPFVGLIIGTGLFILLLLTACQTGPVAGAAIEPAGTAVLVPTDTRVPAPVQYTVAAPDDLPSFAPVDPNAISTATPPPTATTAAAIAAATVASPATDTVTPSPTPPPTFTPPALPLTLPQEHYWLRRPIPEGRTVWTDKVYPYGSTKGGALRPHHGVEFYVPTGTDVLAAASGTVTVAGNDAETVYGPHANFYGNLVIIELDSRWNGRPVYNLYAHLSEILVTVGQQVDAQETIALTGATGVADGPHLHFEVRLDANSYDNTRNPMLWLYPFPDFGAVAGRITWPDGSLVQAAPITLRRVDAPSRYLATTSYVGNGVNPDDVWNENFAIDDVPAGYYEVEVNTGEKKYKEEVWVYPYRTSFVEIVLGPSNQRLETED